MQDNSQITDTHATLTCPECMSQQKVLMPTEAKQHYFKCYNEQCAIDISVNDDECCIFCKYSDKKCPFKQIDPNEDSKKRLQSLI